MVHELDVANPLFAETTEAGFDSLVNVHSKSAFFLTQTLLPIWPTADES